MDKPDKVTKAISVLLFIAMICYIGVYIWQSVSDPVQTAMAITVTVRESAPLSGIVIRDEQMITSRAAYIDVTAGEGKRVSKGDPLAVSYQSEAALARAGRIRELELEIARMETLLSGMSTAQDLTTRDAAVRSSILSLSAAIARHDLSELDSSSLNLRSLVFDAPDSSVSYEALGELKFELNGLYTSSSADTVSILAENAGVFSSILDGYEHLTAEGLASMTPDGVQALMQDRREVDESAIGKLVCSSTWYYAAVADSSDIWMEDGALRLKFGSAAALEFGRYYNTDISAKVVSVGPDTGGKCVVIFSCGEALAGTLAMRQASAEVIYAEHTGIRVPREGLHSETDENGETVYFVYTLTALQAERKDVDIVYEGEDFVLVQPPNDAENEAGQAALLEGRFIRDGNDIIVNAKDIYDGKVMG